MEFRRRDRKSVVAGFNDCLVDKSKLNCLFSDLEESLIKEIINGIENKWKCITILLRALLLIPALFIIIYYNFLKGLIPAHFYLIGI